LVGIVNRSQRHATGGNLGRAHGKHVGYIRVSTVEQNTDRQLDGIELAKVFTDKASGKDAKRPQLQAALNYLREGDTLVAHSMDRLARNTLDLLQLVRDLNERGVAVQFLKERLTFTGEESPMAKLQLTILGAKLQLTILGAVAEFERSLIRERQREGIAIAKQNGVYKGRKRALDDARVKTLRERDAANGGRGRSALAQEFGISRETLYQYLRAQ
jgi:DNA invertase Pin-like site-specific DNA recombinase